MMGYIADNLPHPDQYQYFSHLFHSKEMIPWHEYKPLSGWDYPESDKRKFEKLFLTDQKYFKDQNILDLGCHHGFMSYIAKTLGASGIHGVNARQHPLDVANFVFKEFGISDYQFEQGNIENNDFLKKVCDGKDTVIFSEVIEHLRNPYLVLETISNSTIKNLVFSCRVSMGADTPRLEYFMQQTNSDFTAYDESKKVTVACCPNTAWLDMILYHLGWKIEHYEVINKFDKEWFAVPGLGLDTFAPRFLTTSYILATKFDSEVEKNNFEH